MKKKIISSTDYHNYHGQPQLSLELIWCSLMFCQIDVLVSVFIYGSDDNYCHPNIWLNNYSHNTPGILRLSPPPSKSCGKQLSNSGSPERSREAENEAWRQLVLNDRNLGIESLRERKQQNSPEGKST